MVVFLWVDSNSEEMCQSNDGGKPPWCGKTSKITWCLPRDKCSGNKEQKFSCVRNVGKAEMSQRNNYPEKTRTNSENVKSGSKMKNQEAKVSVQKKKWTNDRKREKGKTCWKEYSTVAAVAFVCYVNAFFGDFVHDDIPAISRNKDVTGQTPVLQVLKNDFWGTAMSDPSSHKSYRPLTTFSFRATHAIVGLEPAWFHLCNIVLHATASILFTRVCVAVVGFQPRFAATAGALFAAHPIHTEAVTGIVGRADVLACVFFLLSFLTYHGESNKSSVWSSIALASLSMLAKETGIMVLLLNICYDFYRSWHSIKRTATELKWNEETLQFSRRAAKVLMSLSLLLVFRLALLQNSLPKFSNQDNPAAFHPYRHVRFLTFCYLAALNCWLLLFPAALSHDWQMGSVPLVTCFSDSRNLATFLFFGCLAFLIYKGILDFEHQKHPPLVLGLSLLILPFLPATNIAVTVGFVVAERLLYIPSLGWTILVVYGLQLLRLKQKLFYPAPVVILIILIFCGRSLLRNRDWNSRESLIRSGLKTLPHNAKMHYNFANFLRDSGNVESAAVHYKEALRLWPTYASAHNNLGTLMSRPEDAEEHFLSAIRYSPNHVNAYYNLGQVYRKINRTSDALWMLQRCVSLDGSYTPAYLLMAKLHALDGRKKMVGQLLRHVVRIHPDNPDHVADYAGWLYDEGLKLTSAHYYERALRISVGHKKSLLGMAKYFRSQGQLPRVHQITVRSHIMARAESGNQIFTGDLYFRSWQLQRQFQQLSNSPNTQDIESSFREATRIKRLLIGMEATDASKEPSPNKNTSNNLVLLTEKNLKLIRRKYGGGGGNKSVEQGRTRSGENSKMQCSTPAAESRATRITIIQSPCRLRCLSLGSVLFLLLINIWLILRQLNSNQCQPNSEHQNAFSRYQDLSKRSQKEKANAKEDSKYQIKIYDAKEETGKGFNLSFHLGRWDKSRLFKLYDFVSVGRNFTSLSEKFSVCMATQSSIEKLHSIAQVAQHWAGPISAALYAAGDEEYFLLHWYITFLKKCFPSVNLKVSFHLAVPRFKIPTGKRPAKLKDLQEKNYDCTQHQIALKELIQLRNPETVKWRMRSPYPQNHLRNLARKNCQSENVFLTDIDIIPSRKLAENLDNFLKSPKRKCQGKCAYVIPTYELDDRTDFPKNKTDLIRLAKKGLAQPFHYKVFIYNQYATNFSRWESYADHSDDEVNISHNVTNFEFLYEPFYVAPDTVPEHDERFLGYGYTRNTQVYEMFVKGYQFQVLSPVFTIHWGLQGRKGRPRWRERQNSLNRQQFEVFKREVFARYRKDPLKMIRN